MPGYMIHAACAKKLIELLNIQDEQEKKNVTAGAVMPDAAKISGLSNASELDKTMHYAEKPDSYFKTPDLKKYFSEHPLSLKDHYHLGYALHLYIDIKFDEYISGKATYIPQSFTDGVMFEYQNCRYTSQNFWSMIYKDYDNSNSEVIRRYKIELKDFPELSELKISSKQISWYRKLRNEIENKFNLNGAGDQLSFFDLEELFSFIDNTTENFKQYYTDSLISQNNSDRNEPSDSDSIFNGVEKRDWYSENAKRKYYIKCWRKLVQKGVVSENDECFMEILEKEIECFDEHARKYKKSNKKSLLILSIIPVMAAMVSAASTLDFSVICNKILAFAASVLSVIITIYTQYCEKAKYKETWLRYRYIYSMLMNETECFCERIDEYSDLEDHEAVKQFMSKINKWRNEDYRTFQNNIGGIEYFENDKADE